MQTTSRRGMIGLDLGRKSRHEVVVLDDMQKFLMKGSLSSTGNLQRLLTAARKHSRGGEIHVVMEATGMAWLVPTEFFKDAGCRVYRVKADTRPPTSAGTSLTLQRQLPLEPRLLNGLCRIQ
jgi:hypothetical protein